MEASGSINPTDVKSTVTCFLYNTRSRSLLLTEVLKVLRGWEVGLNSLLHCISLELVSTELVTDLLRIRHNGNSYLWK